MSIFRRWLVALLLISSTLSFGLPVVGMSIFPHVAAAPSQDPAPIEPAGTAVVNLPVPYVHQLWDTADAFHGGWACGPTSAIMALAYYHKLTPHPITISSPSSHTNDYGFYVSSVYTAFNYTYNRVQNDAARHAAYGGYGRTTIEGGAWAYLIQEYVQQHGLQHAFQGYPNPPTFNDVKAQLDQGYLVVLSTNLTTKGHIILVRGYTNDGKIIVNDPYGNKFGPNGYGKPDGENIQYGWNQFQALWMVVIKGQVDPDDSRVLTVGQSLSGNISPNNDDDVYSCTTTAGTSLRLTMQRPSGTLDSYLELYGPNGLVAINDDADNSQNSRIDFRAPVDGAYRVVAHSYNRASSGAYQITLSAGPGDGDDNRWLSLGGSLQGTISPNTDRDSYYFNGTTNAYVSLRMNRSSGSLDSYLELYSPNGALVASNDDGGGNLNSWIIYRFPSTGTYRLIARSYNASSGGDYALSAESIRGQNYALNHTPTTSSSENASLQAPNATDGNRSTRWSSGSNLSQLLTVDFGQVRDINQVVIRWEAANANAYTLYYLSTTTNRWEVAYSTNTGNGDIDALNVSFRSRYIRLLMSGRNARWNNYSLWEIEAYDTVSVLAPLVPPDDVNKAPEVGYTPLAPLAPNPDGKDLPTLSLPSDQETQPLMADSSTVITPTALLSDTFGPPTTTLTISALTTTQGTPVTVTAANAHDTDSNQIGSGISAYRWAITPATPGETGASAIEIAGGASVEIPGDLLTEGSYNVILSVQDDEGSWSDPVSAPLQVLRNKSFVYLPMMGSR